MIIKIKISSTLKYHHHIYIYIYRNKSITKNTKNEIKNKNNKKEIQTYKKEHILLKKWRKRCKWVIFKPKKLESHRLPFIRRATIREREWVRCNIKVYFRNEKTLSNEDATVAR